MDYIFISKIAILIGLFFLTRYFYKVNDWNKKGTSKKEDYLMYLIVLIILAPIGLAFGTFMHLIMDIIPNGIINLIDSKSYLMQIIIMFGFIIFYFGFLIWRDGKREKKIKEGKDRDDLIDKIRDLQILVSIKENEIEELKNKLKI